MIPLVLAARHRGLWMTWRIVQSLFVIRCLSRILRLTPTIDLLIR